MAEIVLSPLVELVLENLVSITRQEINLVRGVHKELDNLSRTLSSIKAVLEDAEEKQVTERPIQIWLNELKLAAYDADDILDEYATEALRFKVEEGRAHNLHLGGQVCTFSFSPCFCINKVKFRRNIGHKIKEIRERLDGIDKDRSAFQLEGRPVSERRLQVESSRETGSYVDESTVIGRDDDKERIRDLLLSRDYNNRSVGGCCVIPIVGLGGLGKTTLSQCVFNEKRVQEHFELKMWVCVSTEFEVKRLIKEIIGKATDGEAGCDLLDLDGLQRRLLEKLTGKRYLLVLDDVWNEDRERWESLRDLLRCGGSGSRIIVTTRSGHVSSIMQTIDPIHLEGLSVVDCWKLFARRAFREGDEGMYPKLVEIGKQIVGKCRGVPLAVKTLGGLMDRKREEREWLVVLQSGMLDIPEDKNGILNALRLSYNYLPSYLKPCFALCSIFPQDYRINKNELIRIWMAQGYIIQPSNERKQMEDVGSDYFEYFLHGCFFQEVQEDKYGNINSCKMHDLFHGLAQSVAGNECHMIEDGRSMGNDNKVLHLSFTNDSTIRPYECYRLRTILRVGWKRLNVEKCLFVKFKCLRVLDLSNCGIKVLPNSIGNLKHLRYLDISGNDFKTLPRSICSLRNLQTLNITRCENLSELPKDIKSMINLRHLEIDNGNKLSFMPVDIGKLTCLQTLPIFHVGKGGASIRELGCLKSLRGELAIYNLENVNKNMEDAKEEVLKDKEDLYSLELYWEHGVNDVVSGQHDEVHEGVFESLKPHTNLKSLHIEGFNGAEFPKWVSDSSFTNLVEVTLIHCDSCQHFPPLGQLLSLKTLLINGSNWVKSFNDDFYGVGNVKGFPLLQSLTLVYFPNLEEWSTNDCQGDMCCLTDLQIYHCPKLRALPILPSLQKLRISDESKITSSRQGLEHITTLKSLTFEECDDIALTLEHHPSLETLKIERCDHLTSIHNGLFQNLFNLTSLEISWCKELKPLPETLQNLTALRKLTISHSSNFASSPHAFKHLTALKSLSIEDCEELECLPEELQYLTALDSLRIEWCQKLGCLPEGLKYLTALKSLSIRNCRELGCLPEELQYLTALDSLRIEWCEKLGCLPEGLKYLTPLKSLRIEWCEELECLPEGLKHLTSLQVLFIFKCPLLVERCKRGGEDWHKISHIPHISIL